MSYIAGQYLHKDIFSLGLDSLVPALVQICRALMYLRSRQIIHGDLKPSNVFMHEDQEKMEMPDHPKYYAI